MNNIKIRQATASEADFEGIVKIYKPNDEGPWSKYDSCRAWITKRLERGFYIRIVEVDGKIVGHAEWIISDEPGRKFLYLGMLEINEDYQRKGIGRLMVADGIEYARKNNCTSVVTSPDMDNRADIFYRKCGFIDGRKLFSLHILTETYKDYKFEKIILDKVPFSAIKEKKYIFGKGQFSSRHMWEVYNESANDRKSRVISLRDETYIQIDCTYGGYLLIWSNSESYSDIIKSALSFAHSIGLCHLDFEYLEDEEKFLDGFEIYDKKQESGFEQIYYI